MVKKALTVPEAGIIIIMFSLALIFWLINPVFLSPLNLAGILRGLSYTGIVAIGLAVCLISGTIDISVGATAGLASVVFAKSTLVLSLFPSIAIALCVGILAGCLNSFVIIKMRVSPFIATISTMYIFRGIANFITSGYTVYPLPDFVTKIGSYQPLGISVAFVVMVSLMIIITLLLDHSVWGLCVRATGSDIESAKCTEVNVNQIQISTLIIVSTFAALAGILVTTILGSGVPTAGTGWELIAIAACAIGGVSLFGYEGSMIGLFCGLVTMAFIQNGLITIGISAYLQNVCIGVILLISVLLDVRRRTYLNLERI